MKKYILFFIGIASIASCNSIKKDQNSESSNNIVRTEYTGFGAELSLDSVYDQSVIAEKYDNLKEGDTIPITFSSTVNEVCKAKGCWMKVALDDQKETMVKFKDYGFFVPKDIDNDTVILQGKAYVTEMPVEEQRHFAEDAGKTKEEIEAITMPKKTYSFLADGVLIKK